MAVTCPVCILDHYHAPQCDNLGCRPPDPLIICIGITAVIGIFVLGYSWEDIEKSMIATNAAAMQANFIIMIVGCLVGVWMAGGIVPDLFIMVYNYLLPAFFWHHCRSCVQ